VPPDFIVISDTEENFAARVKHAVANGMQAQPNTMQLSTVGGAVIFSQAFVRDPGFDHRRRTDARTREVAYLAGQA
jgi:hypothetical protein